MLVEADCPVVVVNLAQTQRVSLPLHDDAERLYARQGWQRCGQITGYALWPDGAPVRPRSSSSSCALEPPGSRGANGRDHGHTISSLHAPTWLMPMRESLGT